VNRRSFFQSLATIGAACSAPGIFLPKFEPVRWKVFRPARAVVNPLWINAPYEICFTGIPLVIEPLILANAPRFTCDYGKMEIVYKYMMA